MYVVCMYLYALHFQRETYFQNHGTSIYNDIDNCWMGDTNRISLALYGYITFLTLQISNCTNMLAYLVLAIFATCK